MAETQSRHIPKEIWWQRWMSLRTAIEGTLEQVTDVREKCEPEEFIHIDRDLDTVFQKLLQGLLDFGDKQFPYFYFGFRRSNPDGEPLPSGRSSFSPLDFDEKDPSPLFVMRRTFDQLASDLETIQRALFSRKYGTDGEKEALCKADYMAMDLLDNGREQFPFKTPRVISYFDESAHTRILPYADVVLIGVPYSFISSSPGDIAVKDTPRDFLVLGHEIGHFVFRHLIIEKLPALELKKVIEMLHFYGKGTEDVIAEINSSWPPTLKDDMPDYLINWLEETFCDVFAALFSNACAVYSMATDLTGDDLLDKLYEDTGTHAIDALRPYIYAITIADAGLKQGDLTADEDLRNSAKSLSEVADGSLENLEKGCFEIEDRKGDKVEVNIKTEFRPQILWLVDSLVQFLLPYSPINLQVGNVDCVAAERIARYQGSSPAETNGPSQAASDQPVTSEQKEALQFSFPDQGLPDQEGPKSFEDVRDDPPVAQGVDKEVWHDVFYADGWAFGDSDARTPIVGGFE